MPRAHAGAIAFNSVTLPASSVWTVDLGGQPSYAVIVGGTVFFTVAVSTAPGNCRDADPVSTLAAALIQQPVEFFQHVGDARRNREFSDPSPGSPDIRLWMCGQESANIF
jgi:hypothetical protein